MERGGPYKFGTFLRDSSSGKIDFSVFSNSEVFVLFKFSQILAHYNNVITVPPKVLTSVKKNKCYVGITGVTDCRTLGTPEIIGLLTRSSFSILLVAH
jgi:hypothetical protein